MKNKTLPFILLSGAIALFGCYPQGPDSTDDFNLVVTNHDAAFNFNSLQTYAMPDSVVKITGNYFNGDSVVFINNAYADLILDAIRDNMDDRGWTEVDKSDNPDIIILPSAIQTVNTVYYDYYYYDYYYWGWWYPYYWGGWYYPYPLYAGSYSTGSVFIQMTYPDGITASDNIPVVWTALLNGLLDENMSAFSARTNSMVQQAFTQSPYLTVNGSRQ